MKNRISELLSGELSNGNTLLYRNEKEREFLFSWLRKSKLQEPVEGVVDVDALIAACDKCPGVVSRKKGFGRGSNRVMIILNSPKMVNNVEISIHRTESADLLRKMINAIGLELPDCYTTNLVKCECRDLLFKPSEMVKNCLEILQAELDFRKPVIAIVMGEILPLQSIIRESDNISWFNTDHTISLIRNPELKRGAWETLKIIKKKYMEVNK